MKTYFNFQWTFLIILTLFSCIKNDKDKIIELLNSDDKTKIMKGCSQLKSEKDTIFIKYLFKDITDERISHDAEFYGISVYQAKIGALKRISGLPSPNKNTYEFDSLNTAFYKKWAINKGYLKE
ncbi:hypothetical protein [Chryseobacterium paludis]|uniref:hypothetical protein n=1 Tax=Chryseobacterium paludis TaxID=2956784 RepID=UPI0021C02414|nr:hypothetical protein [Chryseobacterium paludis]